MTRFCWAAAACFLFTLAGCSKSASLVGKWEVKAASGGMPAGATVEFTSDGKLNVSASMAGQSITMQGTYKHEGDKLTVTMSPPGMPPQTETDTIKSLTDKELVLVNPQGKEETLVRK